MPLTISYEFDPCDYLKAQELQEKRDIPGFKKSRQDDLDNMKTGIFGYKGRVMYHCAAPVNTWIDELAELPKTEFFTALAQRMDKDIHRGAHYTADDKARFETYLAGQLAKISIPNKDEAFLRESMLKMYANPLRNKLAAE